MIRCAHHTSHNGYRQVPQYASNVLPCRSTFQLQTLSSPYGPRPCWQEVLIDKVKSLRWKVLTKTSTKPNFEQKWWRWRSRVIPSSAEPSYLSIAGLQLVCETIGIGFPLPSAEDPAHLAFAICVCFPVFLRLALELKCVQWVYRKVYYFTVLSEEVVKDGESYDGEEESCFQNTSRTRVRNWFDRRSQRVSTRG